MFDDDDEMEEYEFLEPTYSDMYKNIEMLKKEIENLDHDSLVDEVAALRYNLEGKDFEKLEYLVAKNYADESIDENEVLFLKGLYIISHCTFCFFVDSEDEEDL